MPNECAPHCPVRCALYLHHGAADRLLPPPSAIRWRLFLTELPLPNAESNGWLPHLRSVHIFRQHFSVKSAVKASFSPQPGKQRLRPNPAASDGNASGIPSVLLIHDLTCFRCTAARPHPRQSAPPSGGFAAKPPPHRNDPKISIAAHNSTPFDGSGHKTWQSFHQNRHPEYHPPA